MTQKDKTQKTLESYNDIFADIVNVLLFRGKRVVSPDELTDATTESQYKFAGDTRSQDRDVAKNWQNGTIKISVIGFENQTKERRHPNGTERCKDHGRKDHGKGHCRGHR